MHDRILKEDVERPLMCVSHGRKDFGFMFKLWLYCLVVAIRDGLVLLLLLLLGFYEFLPSLERWSLHVRWERGRRETQTNLSRRP